MMGMAPKTVASPQKTAFSEMLGSRPSPGPAAAPAMPRPPTPGMPAPRAGMAATRPAPRPAAPPTSGGGGVFDDMASLPKPGMPGMSGGIPGPGQGYGPGGRIPWAMDPIGQIVYGTDVGAPRSGINSADPRGDDHIGMNTLGWGR